VLLVDDNDAVRLTLGAIIEDAGHVVAEAESLAAARAQLGGGAGFDLVLLDLHLGDGEGTSIIPEVRARIPRCAIAVLTGAQSESIAGADAVLAKGDDPMSLLARMERLVK
jgi:two-component system OmpR family response regulator